MPNTKYKYQVQLFAGETLLRQHNELDENSYYDILKSLITQSGKKREFCALVVTRKKTESAVEKLATIIINTNTLKCNIQIEEKFKTYESEVITTSIKANLEKYAKNISMYGPCFEEVFPRQNHNNQIRQDSHSDTELVRIPRQEYNPSSTRLPQALLPKSFTTSETETETKTKIKTSNSFFGFFSKLKSRSSSPRSSPSPSPTASRSTLQSIAAFRELLQSTLPPFPFK